VEKRRRGRPTGSFKAAHEVTETKGEAEPPSGSRVSERIKKYTAGQLIIEEARKRLAEEQIIEEIERIDERKKQLHAKTPGEKQKNKSKRKAALLEEVGRGKLEEYNYLVTRHFCDEDGALFQVINTFRNKDPDMFMATVVKEEERGCMEAEQTTQVPILGAKGVKALVQQFEGRGQMEVGEKCPVSEEEWLEAQRTEWGEGWKPEAGATNYAILSHELRIGGSKEVNVKGTRRVFSRASMTTHDGEQVMGPLKCELVHKLVNKGQNTKVQLERTYFRIVVPSKYRKAILYQYHEQLGHPGQRRTLNTLIPFYYWDELGDESREYVKKCDHCHRQKALNARAKPPSQKYEWPDRPLWRVHMDLTELTTTLRGNRYIVVLKDALTKWVEMGSLPDKTADSVISWLVENVVLRHGVPHVIITDKGSENCNSIMDDVMKVLGCTHINTTPHNPRSDGLAENQMRTLKEQLASWTNKFQTDWDVHLQKAAHAYRTTINEATGFTPFYLMHGRECNGPTQEHLHDMNPNNSGEDLEDYAEELRFVLSAAWEIGASRVVSNVDVFNRMPRRHLEFKPYIPGQYVFLKVIPKRTYSEGYNKKKFKLCVKLQPRYVGPFRIRTRINDVLYEADVHNKIVRVHAFNMKPY
jgi:hypothetical protein